MAAVNYQRLLLPYLMRTLGLKLPVMVFGNALIPTASSSPAADQATELDQLEQEQAQSGKSHQVLYLVVGLIIVFIVIRILAISKHQQESANRQ